MAPLSFTENGRCEEIYQGECKRLANGRFAVPLPCRTSMSEMNFPGSREHAIKRFEGLEKRLSADAKLKSLYSKFMSEYIALGHMSAAGSPGIYFVPHHAVYRPDDGDDKIRVVFDASAKCAKGLSLNDCLMQGPKLQQDIVDVLTRFEFRGSCSLQTSVKCTGRYLFYQNIVPSSTFFGETLLLISWLNTN